MGGNCNLEKAFCDETDGRAAAKMNEMTEYTAIVQRSGDYWIGWIEEVPGVNCQESTREELLETLRITLAEALEFDLIPSAPAAEATY
jgi:predicted RNase H-like HicB family nuclease